MLYIHKPWLVLGNGGCVRPSMLPSEINGRVENSFGAMLFVRICTHFMPEAFWSSHGGFGAKLFMAGGFLNGDLLSFLSN